jgi:hypothetical protein
MPWHPPLPKVFLPLPWSSPPLTKHQKDIFKGFSKYYDFAPTPSKCFSAFAMIITPNPKISPRAKEIYSIYLFILPHSFLFELKAT